MGISETGTAEDVAPRMDPALADEAQFAAVSERHRRELKLHCYRMLGSFEEADDLVQETFLRAWRSRQTYAGRSTLRAWLYGIATNGCLDLLAKDQRRVMLLGDAHTEQSPADATAASPAHVPWLQPFPDRLLEIRGPQADQPDVAVASKENIGLAFLVALQFLPAKQRAALILCDVLDWSAKEAATLLDLSVPAFNSALQRARATLKSQQTQQTQQADVGMKGASDVTVNDQHRLLLEQYVSATERGDAAGLAGLLRDDARFSMPPTPGTWSGRDNVVASWVQGGFGSDWFGEFRCLCTRANRTPAVACYLRKPGESSHRAMTLDVLAIEGGLIKEVTTFPLRPFLDAFDLPAAL